MERSFVQFGKPVVQPPALGDEMNQFREIQASIFTVPKNKKTWTGLDMLKENNQRMKEMRGIIIW